MTLQVQVLRRAVKRIRLEFSPSGLKVVVPKNYQGDIQQILLKHKAWIAKRAVAMSTYQEQAKQLPIDFRSEAELESLIKTLLTRLQSQMQVNPSAIRYRQMKARWGSCSHVGVITLNKNLKYLPEKLINYVLAHELTHLRYMNHSPSFWQELSRFVADYQDCKRLLKLYGFALHK